jgi:hypothetical protein
MKVLVAMLSPKRPSASAWPSRKTLSALRVDAGDQSIGRREHDVAIGHHLAGRRLRGRHHRDRARRMAFVEVLRVGGVEDVEAKIQIRAAVGNLVRSVERRVGDLDVGDHRAALLRQAGLVETDDMLAFQPRRVGQGRYHGH